MQTVEFKGNIYPAWQATGNAARFSMPIALEVCEGEGYDIGCNRPEWAFPGSVQIDPLYTPWSAENLPAGEMDYIHSSHCLEHLPHWVNTLDYWYTKLKSKGVLFLYLPDHSQMYWRGHHNRKHIHHFNPEIIRAYFKDQPEMWEFVLVSEVDLNNSFIAIAWKK